MSKTKDFHGVIVYEIIKNGDWLILNGIYTNNGIGEKSDDEIERDKPYEINNEIAKRKIEQADDGICGKYKMRYIDSTLVNGELTIVIKNEAYYIEWFIKGEPMPKYAGMGLMAGPNHLAVSYIEKY